MELRTAIGRRRMTRTFSSDPVDREALDSLLDLARRGPSAGNTQATGFVVLDRPDLVARYWDVTLPDHPADPDDASSQSRRRSFRWQTMLEVPVLVLVTTDPGRYLDRYSETDKQASGRGDSIARWPVPYWWVDAGAVVQNLLLLATEAGLGACLFGPFDHEPAIKEEFRLPESQRLVATIAIGHPLADEPGRSADRPRPTLDTVIHRPS